MYDNGLGMWNRLFCWQYTKMSCWTPSCAFLTCVLFGSSVAVLLQSTIRSVFALILFLAGTFPSAKFLIRHPLHSCSPTDHSFQAHKRGTHNQCHWYCGRYFVHDVEKIHHVQNDIYQESCDAHKLDPSSTPVHHKWLVDGCADERDQSQQLFKNTSGSLSNGITRQMSCPSQKYLSPDKRRNCTKTLLDQWYMHMHGCHHQETHHAISDSWDNPVSYPCHCRGNAIGKRHPSFLICQISIVGMRLPAVSFLRWQFNFFGKYNHFLEVYRLRYFQYAVQSHNVRSVERFRARCCSCSSIVRCGHWHDWFVAVLCL